MNIEVFKESVEKVRLFDAINPDYVSWMFDSKNRRDGVSAPPYRNEEQVMPEGSERTFINGLAPIDHDLPGTIYFDYANIVSRVYSTQKNIVLDYASPALMSYTGSFTGFNSEESGYQWTLELVIKDDSGIDLGAYTLQKVVGEDRTDLVRYTRKNGVAPYWNSEAQIDNSGILVEVTQSPVDKSMYRISVKMDPSNSELSALLTKCDDDCYFEYLRLGFTFYDIAGNALTGTLDKPFVKYNISSEELFKDVRKLSMSFVDTYPSNLFIDENVIGKTTISVSNPNSTLIEYGFKIKIGLRSDSVGYLSGATDEDLDNGTATRLVDGIDRSGSVIAYAYLDGSFVNVECNLSGETISFELDKSIFAKVKSMTYVEKELGTFITECEDNKRKIYVDPFVPSVLKNEKIFGLCKLFERYLNSMYTPLSGDCRIGILEKIERVGEFKDPDFCEPELLPNFAEEHGSELVFNYKDVKEAAEILAKYESSGLTEDGNELTDKIYRRYYSILPYIDRWKGTMRSIELLYRVLGIDAKLSPLWEGPTGDMVEEDKAASDYRLSSHLSLTLRSEKISTSDMKKLSNFAMKAVKSILPVNRVISDVKVYDNLVSERSETFLFTTTSVIEQKPSLIEKIAFAWHTKNMKKIVNVSGDTFEIVIPMFAEEVEVGHTADASQTFSVPDNCAFYFTRFARMIKAYDGEKDLTLSVAGLSGHSLVPKNVILTFKVTGVSLGRNTIKLKAKKTRNYQSLITVYNNNLESTTSYIAAAFKFSRAVDDYCESMSLADYDSQESLTTPYQYEES